MDEIDDKTMKLPPRTVWREFADAVLLATESETRRHPEYADAKTGDAVAAAHLVRDLVGDTGIAAVRTLIARVSETGVPVLVSASAYEHAGADGYGRLARQARFDGDVEENYEYVMVDDFIGQGGTLANLRGWIESRGGRVVGAVALTGKFYSAKLSPTQEQ